MHKGYATHTRTHTYTIYIFIYSVRPYLCVARRACKAQGLKKICRNFGAKMQVDKPVALHIFSPYKNLCAFFIPSAELRVKWV